MGALHDHSSRLLDVGWGANAFGFRRDRTLADRIVPAELNGLSGITAIVVLCDTGYEVKSDGTVWTWRSEIRGDWRAVQIRAYYALSPYAVRRLPHEIHPLLRSALDRLVETLGK